MSLADGSSDRTSLSTSHSINSKWKLPRGIFNLFATKNPKKF
jgi:hypothetical protein